MPTNNKEVKESEKQVTPDHIMQVGFGFFMSKILMSAIDMDLFTKLAQRPMSPEEISRECGIHERGLYDFLDALVALRFLEREGLKEDATYFNAPQTGKFLDKNSRGYIGGILEMANDRLYPFWGDLEKALQTGQPQNEIKDKDEENLMVELYRDEERMKQFLRAMAGTQMGNFMALVNKFDFTPFETHCDVGGADGELCIQVASEYDHIKCINFDMPKVVKVAEQKIERFGLEDQITTQAGDFWEDELPQADVITMGNILHDWGLEDKITLLEKAYHALPDDGACIVIENIIDNDRSENLFGLAMSLNMLVETKEGFDFTPREFENWVDQVGFSETEIIPLAGPASAAIAYK